MLFILIDDARRDNCLNYIRGLNLGKRMQVEIKPYRKNRSQAQNRTMWAWINTLADHTGYSPDELHEMFKQRFLGFHHKEIMGETVLIAKSTTKLSTHEFAEYMNKIEAVAAQMGVQLPIPDDYGFVMSVDTTGGSHVISQ